jgi:SET domain-containing protein
MLQQHPGLYFAPSGKHRYGMFCTEDISAGSVIEICPIIVLTAKEAIGIDRDHILYQYYFEWKGKRIALALGYGSLYNHAAKPNAFFEPDYEDEQILFKAAEDIPAGTEIVVDYHAGTPDVPLWFEVN